MTSLFRSVNLKVSVFIPHTYSNRVEFSSIVDFTLYHHIKTDVNEYGRNSILLAAIEENIQPIKHTDMSDSYCKYLI